MASLEGGPLLCCACTQRGERALVVAGSSAGWLVVVDLTKEEEEAQVRARVLAAGALFAPSRVFCSAPQISHFSSNLLIAPTAQTPTSYDAFDTQHHRTAFESLKI